MFVHVRTRIVSSGNAEFVFLDEFLLAFRSFIVLLVILGDLSHNILETFSFTSGVLPVAFPSGRYPFLAEDRIRSRVWRRVPIYCQL